VAYTIGRAQPVSVMVGAYGTGVVSSRELTEIVKKLFDLRPAAVIERLNLKRPIYRKTCNYGHFGRELPEFSWEKLDMVEDLKRAIK
jgi:S-adenosylmethionine synthetase